MRVVAVDLGATSVRVAAVDLSAQPPRVEVVHRHAHSPRSVDGALRWDWPRLMEEVERGLRQALDLGPAASIGVDTWGVDYGLIDEGGALLSLPYSYRDARTADWAATAERIGRERLYSTTGIQLMAPNTVFQLAAHDRRELARAQRLLLLPELVVHHLTGHVTAERTSAGTTALVDVATGDWATDLVDEVGVDPTLLAPIAEPTSPVGTWQGIPVHLVGGHDTASAVLALAGPPPPGAAFVSTGTWLLVGAERPAPDTSEPAMLANFSNEPGAFGGVRFLKNVMGFWLLEQCRPAWGNPSVSELVAAAELVPAGGPLIDARDERFLAPPDMEAEIRAAAKLPESAGRDRVVRCIIDSMALSTAGVVAELGTFLERPISEIHMLGGGSRTLLLSRGIEEATGVPVRVGATEATALGNALAQGIALGLYAGVDEARAALVAPDSQLRTAGAGGRRSAAKGTVA